MIMGEQEVVPWIWVFDMCQLMATSVGFVLNLLTLITLIINHEGFNQIILALLRQRGVYIPILR